MLKKIKINIMTIASLLMLVAPVALPAVSASAACSEIANQIGKGATNASGNSATCGDTGGVDQGSIGTLANKIVNLFSYVVGAIAIIFVIVAGFRYITSGGDSNKVGAAKNTLIYALVGLVIVALAQIIVKFVLTQTGQAVTG